MTPLPISARVWLRAAMTTTRPGGFPSATTAASQQSQRPMVRAGSTQHQPLYKETEMDRVLESLIAQRKLCGGGKTKDDCRRPRCKRCQRGIESQRRNSGVGKAA